MFSPEPTKARVKKNLYICANAVYRIKQMAEIYETSEGRVIEELVRRYSHDPDNVAPDTILDAVRGYGKSEPPKKISEESVESIDHKISALKRAIRRLQFKKREMLADEERNV